MNLTLKNSQKKYMNKLSRTNDNNNKKCKVLTRKDSKKITKNISIKKSTIKNIKSKVKNIPNKSDFLTVYKKSKKNKYYFYSKNNKNTLRIKQSGLGIFGDFVYNTSIFYIFEIAKPFVIGFFPKSRKIFDFFENSEKGGKLIRLGLCDEAIVNVYIPICINCLQIYFLIMGIILLQISTLLTATVFLSPFGIVVGFFSSLSNTFSGFLIATRNIYLSTSLNQNLDQINNIILDLINLESNPRIKEVMNKFFKLDGGLIIIGKELEEIMSFSGIKCIIKRENSEDQEIDDLIRLESQLCNVIKSIESIINTLDLNDISILYYKSERLLEHICFAIGNFISLQLQYDSGTFGYSLKILVCDSYPDKTDIIIKHLFKLLPNFILNFLVNQVSLFKSIEEKLDCILDFFQKSPYNIFDFIEKNFPDVNWEPIYGQLRMLPIATYNDIMVGYLRNFNKIFLKNLKTVGLFLPLILIFSTIRLQYTLKIEQKENKEILNKLSASDDSQSREEKLLIEEKIKNFQAHIEFNKIKEIIQPAIKSKIHHIIISD